MSESADSLSSHETRRTPFAEPVWPLAVTINEDLYCVGCGYNLRGLSGDPVRCPECAEMNDRAELAIPQPVIQAALKQMETAPTVCVGCALLFVLFATLTVVVLRDRRPDLAFVFSGVALVCVVAWPIAQNWVRRSFNDQDEWRAMLAEFHAAGTLGVLWYPLLLAFALFVERSPIPISPYLGWVVAAVGVCSIVVGLRFYKRARMRILMMKRAAAVRLAQQILRKATLTRTPL